MTNPTPATVAAATAAPVKPAKLTKTELRAVRAYAAAKRAEVKAIASKKRWEKVVRDALGDATVGTTEDGTTVVKLQAGSNSSFDREILKTVYPAAYAAAYVKTEYNSLRVL